MVEKMDLIDITIEVVTTGKKFFYLNYDTKELLLKLTVPHGKLVDAVFQTLSHVTLADAKETEKYEDWLSELKKNLSITECPLKSELLFDFSISDITIDVMVRPDGPNIK